jgi:outer membrane lipopolysaccharide assembly protein LptE/RlpB
MPDIAITIHLVWLIALVLISAAAGFLIRSRSISSHKKKIIELENEMLRNHADILELQKQKSQLEQTLNASDIPVIPIKSAKEEKPSQSIKKHS